MTDALRRRVAARALAAAFALASTGLASAVLSPPAGAQITFFFGIQYANKLPSDPTYAETTLDIFYPSGGCPAVPGCENQPRPTCVMLRGGNSNNPYSGVEQISPIAVKLLAKGFIVVVPNFHVIDFATSESWLNATKDAARAIQWIRHYATTLNVHPTKIFAQGHSAGASHAMYLGLNADFQDLTSLDPIDHESSRPNFIAPWAGPTNFLCFDPTSPLVSPSWTSEFFFGTPDFASVSQALKVQVSPVNWTLNPGAFNRPFTPPIGGVFKLDQQSPCGQIHDPHDGKFGPLIMSAYDRYCMIYGDPTVCSKSLIIDTGPGIDLAADALVNWMAATAG